MNTLKFNKTKLSRREPLLEVKNLRTSFNRGDRQVRAVDGVDLRVMPGEILGIVGESGSGKSTVLKSILQIIQEPGRTSSDLTRLEDRRLDALTASEWSAVRGGQIGMIFQDPINSFNPAYTIRHQFSRFLQLHRPELNAEQRESVMLDLLGKVGIDGASKLNSYPFQFSQGQLQRIMIAIAASSDSLKVLFADEPTTSLDVIIAAQVLELLKTLRDVREVSIVLVTHDLSVVAEVCDRVVVMYSGRVVEEADVFTLFDEPAHPYTRQLLRSVPSFPYSGGRLHELPGEVPDLATLGDGCAFANRCGLMVPGLCDEVTPTQGRVSGNAAHFAACHLTAPTDRTSQRIDIA